MNLYLQLSLIAGEQLKEKTNTSQYTEKEVERLEKAAYENNRDAFYKVDKEKALAYLVLMNYTDTYNLSSLVDMIDNDMDSKYPLIILTNICNRSADMDEIIFFIERYFKVAFPKIYNKFDELLPYMSVVSTDINWLYRIHNMLVYKKADSTVVCRKMKIKDAASEIMANKQLQLNTIDLISTYSELEKAKSGVHYAITNGYQTRDLYMNDVCKEFLKFEKVFDCTRQEFKDVVSVASLSSESLKYIMKHPDVEGIILNKANCKVHLATDKPDIPNVSTIKQYRAKILLYGFHIPVDIIQGTSSDSLDILWELCNTYPEQVDRIVLMNQKMMTPMFFRTYIRLIREDRTLLDEFCKFVDECNPTPSEMKRWMYVSEVVIKSIMAKSSKEVVSYALHKTFKDNYSFIISCLYVVKDDKEKFYRECNDIVLDKIGFKDKMKKELEMISKQYAFIYDFIDVKECQNLIEKCDKFYQDVYKTNNLNWIKKYDAKWMIDLSKARFEICKEKKTKSTKFYYTELHFKQKIAPMVFQLDERIGEKYFKELKKEASIRDGYSETEIVKMYHNLAIKVKNTPPEEKITVLELFEICPVYDTISCYKYIDQTSKSDSYYLQRIQHRFEGKLHKSKDEDLLNTVIGIKGKMNDREMNQKAIDYMDRHGYKHFYLLFMDIIRAHLRGELSLDD